jgi:hypothetical protein
MMHSGNIPSQTHPLPPNQLARVIDVLISFYEKPNGRLKSSISFASTTGRRPLGARHGGGSKSICDAAKAQDRDPHVPDVCRHVLIRVPATPVPLPIQSHLHRRIHRASGLRFAMI